MNPTPVLPSACAEARERMHAVLDGGLQDAAIRQELDRHVDVCVVCREVQADLVEIQGALRRLPSAAFPDADFDALLARTSRATAVRRLRSWGDWRAVAAAALLAAAIWSVWPTGPDQAEVDQATAEARLVLMLTAQALSRTQRAAIQGVMTDEVAPALSRVPMNLPTATHPKEL